VLERSADPNQFKKSMIKRLIIAVVLIALLVVGLVLIERIQVPKSGGSKSNEAVPAVSTPEPVVVSKPDIQAQEETETQNVEPVAEPSAEEAPPPPIVINARPETEGAVVPRQVAKAPSKPTEARLTLEQEPPAKPVAVPKSFVVQIGVFTSTANAEELREKLEKNGIKAFTETRVQLGPFKSRAEADQAREKLKKLGISSVIVPGK
jgi:DedD protein